MTDALDQRAKHLEELVRRRYAAWAQDREMFAQMFPGITIELRDGQIRPADELRAVAETVMRDSGFDWRVLETVDGQGIFSIGQYEGGR